MRAIIISLIMYTSVLAAFAQDPQSLTLQECIDYALQNNEQGKITTLEKEIAAAEVRKTLAMGLPQVEINSGLNYNFEPQKSLIDISTLDPNVPPGTEQEVSFAQNYDGNVGISLRQLIFDGSFFVGLQASRTYQELSKKDHIKTEIDIVESVSKAYYTVLINEERLELLQKNFQRLDTLLRDTRALNENGFAESIDVGRVRVNYNNLKVEISKLTQLLDVSRKLLKFQMGMPLEMEVELAETLDQLKPEPTAGAVDFSYEDRIEFSQLRTNENLVRLDMKNNKVQYLPRLYANVNYGYNTAARNVDLLMQGNRWLSFGTIGLSLNIPVFDGFLKSNRIQQNKLQLKQIEASMNMIRKTIDLEVQQSGIKLNSNVEALEVQKENMELAEEIYRITQIKYREGVGSNLEVMEADAALKEAQTNYYSALFDAMIAEIELRKALGTLHTSQP